MKLQRSYHKEVQQIAAHCGIEGSVPLSPPLNEKGTLRIPFFRAYKSATCIFNPLKRVSRFFRCMLSKFLSV